MAFDFVPNLNSQEIEKLGMLKQELIKFNQSINLISPSTVKDADTLHFADSILATRGIFFQSLPELVYDLGSGNGFPGLISAILNPGIKFVLVDRDSNKIEYIKHCINLIEIDNASCMIHNIGQDRKFSISFGISRAMAPLGRILKESSGYFESKSKLYLLKSTKWQSELATDPIHLKKIWSWKVIHEYSLPSGFGDRVVIEAIKN